MKIGILTSGGDCQSLNATMRGVAKSLYHMGKNVEIIGFENGYQGLIYGEYRKMKPSDFSGILTKGGTIHVLFLHHCYSSIIKNSLFHEME